MRLLKKFFTAFCCMCMAVGLVSCSSSITDDATVYVQGLLDSAYLGKTSQEYIDVVEGMTEADAQEERDTNLEVEADYMLSFLAVEMPTDVVNEWAREVVAEIYSYAKYSVKPAEKLSSGDLAVEVTVSPIEIIPLVTDDQLMQMWEDVKQQAGVTDEDLMMMSDEEYQAIDEQYAMALLDHLESLIPEITYGEDQIIMLQMKEEDGYYSLVDSGMQKLDEVMIDYNGSYMQQVNETV